MAEIILILVIVILAAYFVTRKLYRQAKYGDCENCRCYPASQIVDKLTDGGAPEGKKPDRNSG